MGRLILYIFEGFVALTMLSLVVFYLFKLGKFIFNTFRRNLK